MIRKERFRSAIDARALHIASNQINFNSIRLKSKRNVGKVKSLFEEANLYSTNGTCAIHWPRIMNERMNCQRLPDKSKSMEISKAIGSIERKNINQIPTVSAQHRNRRKYVKISNL